ncbi:MAG: polyprenyl diphosphate synthase [Planctomycetota bacterium]
MTEAALASDQASEGAASQEPTPSASDERAPWLGDESALAAIDRILRVNPAAKPSQVIPDVHPTRIPRHIAVIMDGNGRWAESKGFPRAFGHRAGAGAVRETVAACGEMGVEQLTLYSFSAENWTRPADEVEALWGLCVEYCDAHRQMLVDERIRFRVIGRRSDLPSGVLEAIERVEAATASCAGPTLCLAINYGSRQELVDATRAIARRVAAGELVPDSIEACDVEAALYTAGMPDPDLLVRTAGEMRLSNYLLWQISYAELYVTDVCWPDITKPHLFDSVRNYASRTRRFGGLRGRERTDGDGAS